MERQERKGNEFLLKALTLRSLEDVPRIKEDLTNRTIVILKVTPLAQTNIEELKSSIEQLFEFATSIGGDMVRLGDERMVISPPGVRIQRERSPSSTIHSFDDKMTY